MARSRRLLRSYFDRLYEAMCEQRYEVQLQLVEPNPQALMLDCGCREGDNSVRMAQCMGTQQIVGLDYIHSALRLAQGKGIKPIQSNLNNSIPVKTDSIDVIIATDVIEHLINPAIFVKEMYRVLKPSGYMILDTPNLASWHNIFALIIGIQPFSGPNITSMEDSDLPMVKQMHRSTHGLEEEGEYQEHDEMELTRHIVVIAYRSLVNLLKKEGFAIDRVYGFGYYPFPPFLARLLQRIDVRHTHHLIIKARKAAWTSATHAD